MASKGHPALSKKSQGAKSAQVKKNAPTLATLSSCELLTGETVLGFRNHCMMLNGLTKHADKLKDSNHTKQFKNIKKLHGLLSKQHAELSAALHKLDETMDEAVQSTESYIMKMLDLEDWQDFLDLPGLTMYFFSDAIEKITEETVGEPIEEQRFAHYFQRTVGEAVDRQLTDGCCGHLHDDLFDKALKMCMPIWMSPRSLHIMLFIATRVLYNKNIYNGNPNNEHVNALGDYWAQRRADALLRELIRDRLGHNTILEVCEYDCEEWVDAAAEFRFFAGAWKAKKCVKATAASPASVWKPCFHMVHAETLRLLQDAARTDIESKVKIVVGKHKLAAELVDVIYQAALEAEGVPNYDVAVKAKIVTPAESSAHMPLCQSELPLKQLQFTMHKDWKCARLPSGVAKIALPIAREPGWLEMLEIILGDQ